MRQELKPMTLEHDERPWANYTVLDEGTHYKVKRIAVHAGNDSATNAMHDEKNTGSSSTEPAA